MTMKKVIITGAAGFIGSALRKRLNYEDVHVVGLDLAWGQDLCNRPGYRSEWNGADTIYHLAGCSDAYQNPADCVRTNIVTAQNALHTARMSEIKRFVFASTYLCDSSAYSISKQCVEHLVSLYGAESVNVRCCNVYGPGDTNTNRVIPSLITKMLRGEQSKVTPRRREFLYIDDVVEAYVAIGNAPKAPKTFNLSGGPGGFQKLDEVANQIHALIPSAPKPEVDTGAMFLDGFLAPMYLDPLLWTPKVNFTDGLQRTIDWWKQRI